MKRFLAWLSDIKNAMRVLEIMDKCSCDIEYIEKSDKWKIKPKWYVSKKDAEDLQKIILHKQHYCKRSKLWKIIFPDIRKEFRYLYEYHKFDYWCK